MNNVTKTNGLTMERVFDAPVELVWKAWSDPEMIKQWWGPNNFSAPVVKIDFKVRGKYLLCMSGKPAPDMPEMTVWSGGTYVEIIPHEKIVVLDSFVDEQGNMVPASHYGLPESFPMEATITISFEKLNNGKTKMTLLYPSLEGIEGEMRKNMTQGWSESFDKLSQILTINS